MERRRPEPEQLREVRRQLGNVFTPREQAIVDRLIGEMQKGTKLGQQDLQDLVEKTARQLGFDLQDRRTELAQVLAEHGRGVSLDTLAARLGISLTPEQKRALAELAGEYL